MLGKIYDDCLRVTSICPREANLAFNAIATLAPRNRHEVTTLPVYSKAYPYTLKTIARGGTHIEQKPELHNPKILAAVLSGMFKRQDNPDHELSAEDYYHAAYSNKFNDQERAAAYLVARNFEKISGLAGNYWLSQDDLHELAGLTNKPIQPEEACDNQQSVAGNALAMGVAVAALSAMMGSKQSMKNGMVAAVSAAATTELVNKANCPNPDIVANH